MRRTGIGETPPPVTGVPLLLGLQPPRHDNLADHLSSVRRSSCLWLQLFSVETFLLPSFFQSVKAMAAIFRAKVRRAISGFIPFASNAA